MACAIDGARSCSLGAAPSRARVPRTRRGVRAARASSFAPGGGRGERRVSWASEKSSESARGGRRTHTVVRTSCTNGERGERDVVSVRRTQRTAEDAAPHMRRGTAKSSVYCGRVRHRTRPRRAYGRRTP